MLSGGRQLWARLRKTDVESQRSHRSRTEGLQSRELGTEDVGCVWEGSGWVWVGPRCCNLRLHSMFPLPCWPPESFLCFVASCICNAVGTCKWKSPQSTEETRTGL